MAYVTLDALGKIYFPKVLREKIKDRKFIALVLPDGDVVLHAVFNALSQAVGGRSIGYYADPLYFEKGISDSKEYTKVIMKLIKEKGYKINNIGIMIEAKKPILEPHSDAIKKSLAGIFDVHENQIGLTFTTGESLTAFGKGEGMQAFAIVSLVKNE